MIRILKALVEWADIITALLIKHLDIGPHDRARLKLALDPLKDATRRTEHTMIGNTPTKKQSEITREEWIIWTWHDITTVSDPERIYIRGAERAISEAVDAGQQWDAWRQAYDEIHKADHA